MAAVARLRRHAFVEIPGGHQAMIRYSYLDSPLGLMLLSASDDALTGVYFVGPKYEAIPRQDWIEDPNDAVLQKASMQLKEYFAGERTQFDLPLAPAGTPFQRSVWQALEKIPSGATKSYGEVAKSIGAPHGVRAT